MRALSVLFAALLGDAAAAPAQWMWAEGERGGSGKAEFSHRFELPEVGPGGASLRFLADFCAAEIALNGAIVARVEAFDPAGSTDVKRWLKPGENSIRVVARGVEGPSAIALDLRLGEADEAVVASGGHWQGAVAISEMGRLDLGGSRLRGIGALDEYNQWMEAKGSGGAAGGAKFSALPADFDLGRIYSAQEGDGSWVSMCFDPRGLVIAREKRGLLRMERSSGDYPFLAPPKVIEDSLLECRGLLFAGGALYANANNSKALCRLRDTNGDGQYDEVAKLMESGGGVGHGRNDLALGHDGTLYSIHGDSVQLPGAIERRTPDWIGAGSPQGVLVRLDTAGGKRELICDGLRNPYGLAFNADGEPFTYDADNEGDIGLPLYRPTRVNHLVSGANYGWHQAGNWSWPVYAPESVPTTLDIGRGSPTAVEFGTKSNFPQRLRDALFILDWAYGRIIAVDVIARGASYTCQAEGFLRGRPLNVTDLTFGPDGAMYFITGGRGTSSALYRVRYLGPAGDPPAPAAQDLARDEFSQQARSLRKRLEAFHRAGAPGVALDTIWPQLDSPDPWIRNAARVALEHQPPERWRKRALDEAQLAALLALARVDPGAPLDALLSAAQRHAFGELARDEKLAVLRIHELALDREEASDGRRALCRDFLAERFPADHPWVNRELSKLLIRLGEPAAVAKSLALLAAAGSQFERLHYLDALADAKSGWAPTARKAFFGALKHGEYFRGDRNMPAYLQSIRNRAVATLGEAERAALGALVDPKPAAEPLPEPRPVVKHWQVGDFTNAPPAGFEPDPKRGAAIFERALCSRCHQRGDLGSAVGPDLTSVANRMNRRDIVEAIVDPSRAVAEIFQPLVVTKKDGSVVVGRLVRDDIRASTISLSTQPLAPSELTKIAKGDIASHARSPASPMPAGLLDPLTEEEVLQLLAFLEAGH